MTDTDTDIAWWLHYCYERRQLPSWADISDAAAEIERLRAALNEVISSLETLGIDGWSEAPHLMSVCRAALPSQQPIADQKEQS